MIDSAIDHRADLDKPVISEPHHVADLSSIAKIDAGGGFSRLTREASNHQLAHDSQPKRETPAKIGASHYRRQKRRASPLLQQQQSQNQNQNLTPPPKLVQWAKEAVQYYEGSTLVLSCSMAIAQASGSQLKFSWFKQAKAIGSGAYSNRLTVENLADYSFLRLADLRSTDSGAYTCAVSNSFGQEDRTTTQVIVNG